MALNIKATTRKEKSTVMELIPGMMAPDMSVIGSKTRSTDLEFTHG